MPTHYGDKGVLSRRRKARQKAVDAPGNTPGPDFASDRSEDRPEGVPMGRPEGSPNPGFSAKTASGRSMLALGGTGCG